jgi:ABC-type lipoprotein release transport system permease subunit
LINLATMPVIGHPVAFAFHPVLMARGFAVTLLMVLFAAWLPAERAARLRLALALRYE